MYILTFWATVIAAGITRFAFSKHEDQQISWLNCIKSAGDYNNWWACDGALNSSNLWEKVGVVFLIVAIILGLITVISFFAHIFGGDHEPATPNRHTTNRNISKHPNKAGDEFEDTLDKILPKTK